MGIFSSLASLTSQGASGALDLVKGWGDTRLSSSRDNRAEAGRGPGKGIVSDPQVWLLASGNYVEKPHASSYSVLHYLWRRDPLLGAIILTRLRQVRSFAAIRTHTETERSIGQGFRIRMRVGNNKKRTKVVERREDDLNYFIANCARYDVPEDKRYERDFATWLWRFVQDRLVYDQACSENVLDRKGKLSQFVSLDGSSIRRIDSASSMEQKYRYVQLYQGRIIARFTDAELAFCPENVSADLTSCGYGMSEMELCLRIILTHIGADLTNQRLFDPGGLPRGLLVAENSEMSDEMIRSLEMRWKAQTQGMRGKHTIPVVGLPRGGKLNFLSFPQPTDLEFGKMLDYIVNVVTGLYGMDPLEINFPNRGGAGQAQSLFSSVNEEHRLVHSKDKGLRPLMSWVEHCINREILPYIDGGEDFEFGFVGWDAKSDKEKSDLAASQVKTFKTVNEVRVEHGLDERDDCDMLLDSVWNQAKAAAKQEEQQAQQPQPGAGPEESDGTVQQASGEAPAEASAEGSDWQSWKGDGSGW